MKKLFLIGAVLAVGCGAAGCGAKSSGSKLEGTKTESKVDRLAGARQMAFAPVSGGTPVDQRVAEMQDRAKTNPTKVDNWVLLGRTWIQKARQSADPGFYLHADACAEIALDLKPQYPLALDLRAVVLINDHKFAEAAALANSILATDADDLMALGVLSDAELELGHFAAAVEAAQKMVDIKPNLPSYSRAGYLRWMTGDTKEAKRIMRLAMDAGADQRDPEPGSWVTVETAKMFLAEGDYEGAEAGFDRALARFPDYPPALLGKARVALALGKYEQAAKSAQASFRGSPLAETAWVWGDAERAAGHADAAEKVYAKLIELGRQGDKRTLAAFLAAEDREVPEALRVVEAELAHRGGVYADDVHAWALFRAGRIAEAKAASDRALSLGTKDALLWYHAGAIRIAAGDVPGGVKLVREALALSPKFQLRGALEASRLLAEHGATAALMVE